MPVVFIEPTQLFNILNQETEYPRVSDPNYLYLIDARTDDEYNESHIVTAKRSRTDDLGQFYLPYDAELECKIHVVVYDGNCKNKLDADCSAIKLANIAVDSGSKNSVKILTGGYEDFSALYPFLRTQKIIYMPRELDKFLTYPCEVVQGMVYLGDSEQATNETILKNLKIEAQLHFSTEEDLFENSHHKKQVKKHTHLQLELSDEVNEDFNCDDILKFITTNRSCGRSILISSDHGMSRCAAACILYVMSYYSWNLKEAWGHVMRCKHNIRPNRGLVRHLSQFEERLLSKQVTDISDPAF